MARGQGKRAGRDMKRRVAFTVRGRVQRQGAAGGATVFRVRADVYRQAQADLLPDPGEGGVIRRTLDKHPDDEPMEKE